MASNTAQAATPEADVSSDSSPETTNSQSISVDDSTGGFFSTLKSNLFGKPEDISEGQKPDPNVVPPSDDAQIPEGFVKEEEVKHMQRVASRQGLKIKDLERELEEVRRQQQKPEKSEQQVSLEQEAVNFYARLVEGGMTEENAAQIVEEQYKTPLANLKFQEEQEDAQFAQNQVLTSLRDQLEASFEPIKEDFVPRVTYVLQQVPELLPELQESFANSSTSGDYEKGLNYLGQLAVVAPYMQKIAESEDHSNLPPYQVLQLAVQTLQQAVQKGLVDPFGIPIPNKSFATPTQNGRDLPDQNTPTADRVSADFQSSSNTGIFTEGDESLSIEQAGQVALREFRAALQEQG